MSASVAIVGAGISGLVAAHGLQKRCRLTVFEGEGRIGGHTHTVAVERGGRTYGIDTGFIVFNYETYPRFTALLEVLGVESQPSVMSFSVRDEGSGLEYRASNLNTMFAQRRNIMKLGMYRLIADIFRFRRASVALVAGGGSGERLGEYLRRERYSAFFISHFIVPMGAAIWSASTRATLEMPAFFFAKFFHNHGFLRVKGQPEWRVIKGGSCAYLGPLTAGFGECIRRGTPVERIERHEAYVLVRPRGGAAERFDYVVIAAHADQALRMLADATPQEREILGAFAYQENDVVLHGDTRMMPRARRAWASWNYHLVGDAARRVAVSYNMNILQSIPFDEHFIVTLNRGEEIGAEKVERRMVYAHPMYTHEGIAAQGRWGEINGVRRTYYCGAYWGNGFHEDGVVSGERAAAALGARLANDKKS